MNRFKKELRKRGFKLECDYMYLPSDEGIETVVVKSDIAAVAICHVSAGWVKIHFDRGMNETEVYA